jgi:hypothetical protein
MVESCQLIENKNDEIRMMNAEGMIQSTKSETLAPIIQSSTLIRHLAFELRHSN